MKKDQNFRIERIKLELAVHFIQFLRDRNAFHSYSSCVRDYHGCTVARFMCMCNPDAWISGAFPYDAAPEGFTFWCDLAQEWNIFTFKYCL